MKVILFNCIVAMALLSVSCSASNGGFSELSELKDEYSIVPNDKYMEQAEAKRDLLEQMFKTKNASQVKSNFGKDIIVSGYEGAMASMVIDAAAEQSPSISSIEIIELIKEGSKIKVMINIEGDGISEGEKYFVLNKKYEFVELNLFGVN